MIDVKLQLLMTIVFPVLLYAAETWIVNKEDEKRLLAFEMRCYRRILAVKWEDRRTNEEIRAVVQRKETVMDTIRMRKLQLFGHICRIPDDRQLKTLLPARRSRPKRGNSYGNVAGCVAGWLAVTLRYCIKTAKPI